MNSEAQNIVLAFDNGKTPKTVCASTWQDEMGKPGDTIYNINDIHFDKKRNVLSFKMNEDITIEIHKPAGVSVSEQNIKIRDAQLILWKGKELEFQYIMQDGKVQTKAISGKKVFNVSETANAFELYTW